jgi:TetR/AcrR family transcriptional repressor of mexJK operon
MAMRSLARDGYTKRGKRQAVMEAACELFVRHGFDHTTMDEIANGAGVSKVTVYSYFADKDSLFRAVLDVLSQEVADGWTRLLDAEGSLQQRLTTVALGILDAEDMERSVPGGASRPHRTPSSLIFADALRAQRFQSYDGAMRAVLRHAVDEGTLVIEDVGHASAQFFGLIQGGMTGLGSSGTTGDVPVRGLDAYVPNCVAMFIRAYRQ